MKREDQENLKWKHVGVLVRLDRETHKRLKDAAWRRNVTMESLLLELIRSQYGSHKKSIRKEAAE